MEKKYIDAEKLIAEVQSLKRRKGFLPLENTEITEAYMARGVQFTCDDIMNLIQSLQQEQQEADLEKGIEQCWQNWLSPSNQSSVEGVLPKSEFSMYARHFYELRKNSK